MTDFTVFGEEDEVKPDLVATQETGLRCGELIDELFKLESEVEDHEKIIEDKKVRIKEIKVDLLPALMASMNVAEWKSMSTGAKVKLDRVLRASLKRTGVEPERHETFVSWLAERGYGAIVKREVNITFGAGHNEEAKTLLAEFQSRDLPVNLKVDINHSTLSATLREMGRNGEAMPDPETMGLNLYDAIEAKITRK